MAFVVGKLSAPVTADTSGFTAGLAAVKRQGERAADQITRKFRDVGRRMRRVGAGMTAAITTPLVGAGTMALKTAADYETLRQSMDILNGSVEEGARNFERLKEFSAETPFQLQDLAEAQNMLQGFSLSADEAFESMSMIGDIAAVTGGDIKGIGIAFGQAAAEGRLMTRDIRQLINQGVPAIQLLANTMDVATSEVLDLASNGEITFEILQQAFRDATREGGMFADGMAKQANTLSGVWSTLKDNVDIALGELGDTIVETLDLKQLVKDVTANIRTITDRFANLSSESQKQILKVAGLIGAGGPMLMALGQAAIAVSAFAKLVRTRFAAITGSVALLSGVIVQQGQLWSKVFGDREKDVDNFTTSARKGLGKIIGPFIEFTEEALGAGEALDSFRNLLSNLGGASLQEAKKALTDTHNIISFINGDVNALNDSLEGTSNSAEETRNTSEEISKLDIKRPFVEAKQVVDEMLLSTDKVFENINQILGADLQGEQMDLSKKLFPPGSLGALQERLQVLRNKLQYATDPEVIARLQNKISETEQQIADFSDTAEDSGRNAAMAMGSLGNALGGVVGQLMRGKEEALSFGNIMASVAPALINVLTGGTGGFASSLASGLFGGFRASGGPVGSGKSYIVGEQGPELFMPNSAGKIIPNHKMGGGMDIATLEKAFDRSLSKFGLTADPEGVFRLAKKGERGY